MPEDNNQDLSHSTPEVAPQQPAFQPMPQPVQSYDPVVSVEQEAPTEPQQFFGGTPSVAQPITPEQQAPLEPLQPQPPFQPSAPVKNKKKRLIITSIIAGAIVVLGVSAYLAYALWYQNPQKVLGDAIIHALNAKTVTYKGTLNVNTKDVKVAVELDGSGMDVASNTNAKVTISTQGKDFKVNGSALTDKDGNLFFKVGNLRALLDQFIAESGMATKETPFDSLIAKIDNKWIRISADDLAQYSKDTSDKQKCATDTLKKLSTDKATKDEFSKIYEQNAFVVIDKSLADRSIGGVDSMGYQLSLSKDKTKSFIDAVNNTQLVKDLQKCDSSIKLDASDMTKDIPTGSTGGTVEVSISRWGHEFTQLKADSTDPNDSASTGTVIIEPLFNKDVKIDAPSDYLTLKQLQTEIESAMSAFQTSLQTSSDAATAQADAKHQQMLLEMNTATQS